MRCPMFEKCSGEVKSEEKCQIYKRNLFVCFSEAEGVDKKIDPSSEACQKCPWKEPAITLAGASWRMQELNQTLLDDEGEVEMEHLAGLAKWGEDEIRKLQAIDIAANKERGNDEPKA